MKDLVDFVKESYIAEDASFKPVEHVIKSEGKMSQLIQNWVLVRRCRYLDTEPRTKKHWGGELAGHMIALWRISYSDKHNLYSNALHKKYKIDCIDAVSKQFDDVKLKEEHIDRNEAAFNSACEDFLRYGMNGVISEISRPYFSNTKGLRKSDSVKYAMMNADNEKEIKAYANRVDEINYE